MSSHDEIESKILEINPEEISKKIESIGGKLEFYKKEFTAVWMKNNLGDKLRLRQEGEDIIAEHKEMLNSEDGVKKAKETPLHPKNTLKESINFFNKIGFKEISRSIKLRTSYLLDLKQNGEGEANIVIDEYSDLDGLVIPGFIEIEAISRDIVIKVATLLGYRETDLCDFGAKELLDYYKEKQEK